MPQAWFCQPYFFQHTITTSKSAKLFQSSKKENHLLWTAHLFPTSARKNMSFTWMSWMKPSHSLTRSLQFRTMASCYQPVCTLLWFLIQHSSAWFPKELFLWIASNIVHSQSCHWCGWPGANRHKFYLCLLIKLCHLPSNVFIKI